MGTQIAIIEGQSKFELLAQLQDIGRGNGLNRPTFHMKVQHTALGSLGAIADVYTHINGIVAEDGSGNCWIIYGYILNGPSWAKPGTGSSFEGFYDTRTRKGHLKPRIS